MPVHKVQISSIERQENLSELKLLSCVHKLVCAESVTDKRMDADAESPSFSLTSATYRIHNQAQITVQ